MHEAIYERLKQVARQRDTITYSEIAPMADLDMAVPQDRNRIAEILDEISRHEHAAARPLLSAVVVHKEDRSPGQGFLTMARSVGAMSPGVDEVTFFVAELNCVFEAWR